MVLGTNLWTAFYSPGSIPAQLRSPQESSASWFSPQFFLFPSSGHSLGKLTKQCDKSPYQSVFKIAILLDSQVATRYSLNLWVEILIWAKKQIISKVWYFIIFLDFERDLGEDRNKNLQRGNWGAENSLGLLCNLLSLVSPLCSILCSLWNSKVLWISQ